MVTNSQIAAALSEIGTLLELHGENPFRTNAYHAAARAIDQIAEDIAPRVEKGEWTHYPGIGKTLHEKIDALVRTGRIPQLDELRANTPAGWLQMLRVPRLGPKKVRALADAGIGDLDELRRACETGVVATIKGFGAKTQQNILEGIGFLETAGGRIRLDTADRLAAPILESLRLVPGVKRAEVCGSVRRRKETIGDLDFLVSAADPGPVMDCFAATPGVKQVMNRGDTLLSVLLTLGDGPAEAHIRADLRVVKDSQFASAQHHFTGSADHNIAMRGRGQDMGFKINEYGLTGPKGGVKVASEAELFAALGLSYIPPEMRENTGEIAAAEQGHVPRLLEAGDVRGVFHNHTTASDGVATLEQMAGEARRLGWEYLGIADHSQSLTVARGLTPERVRRQHRDIDEFNAQTKGFRLFHGTECDILADGSLDFPDGLLAEFDYVVVSVHSHFAMPREEMTRRIVRAVSHPQVTMLGHATGRLLLKRAGYDVDLDAVIDAAAEHGTMIEINAQPMRLDLDWIHVRRARDKGVMIVINPDAHSTEELSLYSYGVDVARRGWLTKDDVFNTRTRAEVEKTFAAGKKFGA